MKLELPQSARAELYRRMTRRFGQWLRHGEAPAAGHDTEADQDSAEGPWPMRYSLVGSFTENNVMAKMQAVTDWAQAWRQVEATLPTGVRLEWESRQWSRLGIQSFPQRLVVDSVQALADWVGEGKVWARAVKRRDDLLVRFPQLQGAAAFSRNLAVFQEWDNVDVARLKVLLEWFEDNPRSGLYLRQLPVPGIDTKWVEARRGAVKDFVQALQGADAEEGGDFHEVCGLTKPSAKLRIRILCPELRAQLHGLCDIEAPVEELARLPLRIRTAVVVENLESGLALPDMVGAVAFMRLGHAISELGRLPWLHPQGAEQAAPAVIYWGDLDTHGLVILARARGIFPQLRAVLMDEQTLLAHRHLWVTEPSPSKAQQLQGLLPAEQQLFDDLRSDKWDVKVRLEQERLPWALCLAELEKAFEGAARRPDED